jgi:flavin-binding protein dodecin
MSRTRKTMIARAFGAEVEYVTAGDYDTAGVVQYTRGGQFYRYIAAVGTSAKSVEQRARAALRKARPETLPSDYPYLVEVVRLREQTAPVVREYFGTHTVFITGFFTEGQGWAYCHEEPYKAGRSVIRWMIREKGVTAFEFGKHKGSVRPAGTSPWRTADFQASELLKSMNARKKAA